MTEAAVAMGRVLARRYVVGRLLGSGAMGTVRAAFDLDLDQEVAIKFALNDELSREETAERFRREVHVATRIKSEHAVRVLDVGSLPSGTPFMVMELLQGRGLEVERAERGVIPVHEAVAIILPVIEVLAEAHAAGVVHRDIKPANLFLEERVGEPRFVKVIDFGVSKSAYELASSGGAITKSGMIMGSPLYMAPEQLRSPHAVDARADIWSLGAILFELVTGFTAHEGDSVAEICATVLRDPPRPITDFGSGLPPRFAKVVMRCLEPDPKRRYANVAELGAALLPFAPGGAVHVERARHALQRSATFSIDRAEHAPPSDSPVTLEVDSARKASGIRKREGRGRALVPDVETRTLDGFQVARATVAVGLVAIGIATVVFVDVPRQGRQAPAASPPNATAFAPPTVAAPGTSPVKSLPSTTASVAPSPSGSTLILRERSKRTRP
jgi:serine/threonine-protein kinase